MPALQDTRVFPGARSPSGGPQGSWKGDLALPELRQLGLPHQLGYSLLFKDVDGSNTGEKNFALDAASVVSEPPATEARGAASMKHVFRVTNSSGDNGAAGDELIRLIVQFLEIGHV